MYTSKYVFMLEKERVFSLCHGQVEAYLGEVQRVGKYTALVVESTRLRKPFDGVIRNYQDTR